MQTREWRSELLSKFYPESRIAAEITNHRKETYSRFDVASVSCVYKKSALLIEDLPGPRDLTTVLTLLSRKLFVASSPFAILELVLYGKEMGSEFKKKYWILCVYGHKYAFPVAEKGFEMIRARSGYKKMQAHPTTANSRISKQHHHHHHQQKKRIGPFSANAISSVLNSAVMIKSTPYSKDVINRNMEIVLSEDVWVMSAFSLSPDYSSFKVNHVRVVPVLAQQPKDTTNNDPIQQQATTAVAPAENVEHHAPAVNTPLLQAPIQQAVPVVAKKRTRKQKAAAEQHEGHAAPQSSNHEQHENDDLFQ